MAVTDLLETNALFSKLIQIEMSNEEVAQPAPSYTYKVIGEVIELSDISETRESIEVTPFSNSSNDSAYLYRKNIDGMYDLVDISMVLNYPDATATPAYFTYGELNTLRETSEHRNFVITYPDAKTFSFDGRIAETINRVALDSQITFEIQVRLDSKITYA